MTRATKGLALLLAYAVLTLWVPGRWAWGLFQLVVFASAAVWTVRRIRPELPVTWSLWLAPLGVATLWGVLQLATGLTVYRWETWNATLNWFTWLVLFFLALQVFEDGDARWAFLRGAFYFGFVLAVLSTIQMFTSGGKIFWLFPSGYKDFVLGPFVYHNEYAAFMEMILPIGLWLALRDRRRAFGYWMMAGMIFASVVAGASRTGTVIMCLETAAFLLLAWRRGAIPGTIAARGMAALVLSGVLFSAVVGWGPLWQRFMDPTAYGGRREFLASSLAMVRDKPWTGAGLGNWPQVYPQYALYDDGLYVTHAHNDWAEWAGEGGLPFLIVIACLAVMTVPTAARSLWGIGILAIWLHCTVEYIFHQRPGLGACFFALLAVLAMEGRAQAKRRSTARPVHLSMRLRGRVAGHRGVMQGDGS